MYMLNRPSWNKSRQSVTIVHIDAVLHFVKIQNYFFDVSVVYLGVVAHI